MNYQGYSVEELLASQEFKEWVLNPNPNSDEFWAKWMESHPEQRENILRARELLLSFRHLEAEPVSREERGEILKSILSDKNVRPLRSPNYWARLYGVAAAITLVLAACIYFFVTSPSPHADSASEIVQVVKENPKGQKTKIRLPDGTMVWLNSESRLQYPATFGSERAIILIGEAFFEVAEDQSRPFKVFSRGIVTTALGTSFNVRAFQNDPKVSIGLVTGKVSLEIEQSPNGSKRFMSHGEMAVFDTEHQVVNISKYNNLNFMKWTQQTIVFKQASLAEIKEKLERWYGVEIHIEGNRKSVYQYTGEFQNESLERVLERLAYAENFSFRLNEKEVFIELLP